VLPSSVMKFRRLIGYLGARTIAYHIALELLCVTATFDHSTSATGQKQT
jgi:hypothetical protein